MPPLDAIEMINMFPSVSGVTLRAGDQSFATGLSGAVETLAEFRSPTQTQFLAASGSTIDEITTGTPVSRGTGFTNARWQTANYRGHLFFANGEDTVQDWDGTTLQNSTFTGATLSELDNVALVRDRLWFVKKDSGSAFFGPIGSISGALSEFDIGQQARKGNLVAVASWSRDTGSGMDDFTVFIMSGGDIVVFEGDAATTFTKIGLYNAPDPIGKRCFLNIGGELIILTKGGYIAISALINTRFAPEETLSEKIRDAVADAVRESFDLFGWEGVNHPDGIRVIFNVPIAENTTYDQHVLNTITGSWGKQEGRNGNTFAEFDGKFYMGGDGEVFRVDVDTTDASRAGANIAYETIQASNSLDNPNRPLSGIRKQVPQIRPFVKGGGNVTTTFGVLPDFNTTTPAGNLQTLSPGVQFWEEITTLWEDATRLWNADTGIINPTLTAGGTGFTFSVFMVGDTNTNLEWFNTDVIWKQGGLL